MGLLADARSIAQRDPAGKSTIQVFFLYSGFHALFYHRIAHWLYNHRRYFLARMISQFSRFLSGIEIHPGATIGSGLFIDHGMGVVIGETAEIGNDCTIYHGVTLGGTGKECGKRHPTIGDNVLIGAGAKILGPFHVGSCSMIGANAVVLNEVPPYSTVVGVPGHVIRPQGRQIRHSVELDHSNTPDPIEQEICRLLHRVASLEKQAGLPVQMEPGRKFKQNCPESEEMTDGAPLTPEAAQTAEENRQTVSDRHDGG